LLEPSEINYSNVSVSIHVPLSERIAYFVDVLALELGDEGGETLIISFDTDRFENALDILGRRGGVSTEGEEKVSCEVLHFGS
jgi:hypothetical protein